MSNGAQCCALEICCPGQQELKAELTKAIGDKAAQQLLDWMADEEIAFAPASFKPVIAEIVASTRKHDQSKKA